MPLLERGARRAIIAFDATATRLLGWRWNPVHQSGTVAVAMLLVLLATGLYLTVFYRLSSPAASVARLAADPWLGSWIRTLHRYASDVFVIAAALHALRMLGQARSWGPRTLAWISGLLLFGAGVICAWTGLVMVWDAAGERLALEGGRLLDALPVFSEPLSRIFAGDRPVPSAFFFVNLFVHIGLPLGMGIALWLHVSRVARPALLPPKPLLWGIIGALTAASVALPAPFGPPADAFSLVATTPIDLPVAWWLPLTERVPAGAAWGAMIGLTVIAIAVPRFASRPRVARFAPSAVDHRLCTGCDQCTQDCPWGAITMVARNDDRPTLVASVEPARCVSCGICAGSCAPMGVGPPGRTGRDQLATTRLAVEQWPSAAPIVAICCEESPSALSVELRTRSAWVHMVPCVGGLHTSSIEYFLRSGAPGVIVFGCPPRDCVGREGPKWLHERVYNKREAELQLRVDRARVRLATVAPGDLAGAIAAFDAFAHDVARLDRPARDADSAFDAACDPVLSDQVAP